MLATSNNLNHANLSFARLSQANLSSANLICADLNNANMVGVNLRNARLSGANLNGAYLSGANLKNAKVVIFPPKLLMLVCDQDDTCRIFNPTSDYRLVVVHSNYQAAQEWLLEDEYERVKGQLLAEEVI